MKFNCGRRKRPTSEVCRSEIQLSIDEAWETARHDPAAKAYWQQLFPDGKKPSQEEFIRRLAQEVSNHTTP